MQAQKESIPDRASVHAKKGDFGPKKPLGVTWVNFLWVCAVGLSEPLPHYSLFCGQLLRPHLSHFWAPLYFPSVVQTFW